MQKSARAKSATPVNSLNRREIAPGDDVVKRCETELLTIRGAAAQVGIAALQQEAETGEVRAVVPIGTLGVAVVPQRLFEQREPSRVFPLPADLAERRTNDCRMAMPDGAAQNLFCD